MSSVALPNLCSCVRVRSGPAKLYLMSGRKKKPLLRLWRRSRDEMLTVLTRSPKSNLSYIPDFLRNANKGPNHSFNNWGHLNCFIGGTFALMAA